MILVDANILLYAEDSASPHHERARSWWDEQLSSPPRVCLCWDVVNAFLRIGTSRRVFARPLSLAEATARVDSWLAQPNVELILPTTNHWEVFHTLLQRGQAIANLVPDAHLAALATCHGCTLCSSDADFSRFPHLTWKNPLA